MPKPTRVCASRYITWMPVRDMSLSLSPTRQLALGMLLAAVAPFITTCFISLRYAAPTHLSLRLPATVAHCASSLAVGLLIPLALFHFRRQEALELDGEIKARAQREPTRVSKLAGAILASTRTSERTSGRISGRSSGRASSRLVVKLEATSRSSTVGSLGPLDVAPLGFDVQGPSCRVDCADDSARDLTEPSLDLAETSGAPPASARNSTRGLTRLSARLSRRLTATDRTSRGSHGSLRRAQTAGGSSPWSPFSRLSRSSRASHRTLNPTVADEEKMPTANIRTLILISSATARWLARSQVREHLRKRRARLRHFSWPIFVAALVELVANLTVDEVASANLRAWLWLPFLCAPIIIVIADFNRSEPPRCSMTHAIFFVSSLYPVAYRAVAFDKWMWRAILDAGVFGESLSGVCVLLVHISLFTVLLAVAKLALYLVAAPNTSAHYLFPFQARAGTRLLAGP